MFTCNRNGTHIKFIKLYKTLTQCNQQGMYVGGNSALKGFLLVCQLLVQLQKQISYFDKLRQKLKKLAMTLHTVAKSSVTT